MRNSSASYPFVSVVIPTFNASKTIKRNIISLIDQSYPKDKYEIIIVDDGSTDETIEIVMSVKKECAQPNIKVIKLEHNCGPAAARNRGILNAEGEIVAFTDSDTIPDRNWLIEIVKAFNDENVGGVRGKVVTDNYLLFPIRVAPIGVGYKTCNIAYRREVLNSVGLFDERFRQPFGEDGDLAHRVLKMGFKIKDSPKAIVFHPVKELNLRQVMRMAMLRRYDVLFFRKHPIGAKVYGERFMCPILVISNFIGLSITGIAILLYLLITFILIFFSKAVYIIIGSLIAVSFFIPLSILLITIYGYKVVLYGNPPKSLPIHVKAKCAIALLLFYFTTVASRIYGSLKYKALMI